MISVLRRYLVRVAVVNFFAFIAVTSWLGGDPMNGHAAAGRFYLAMHGHSVEVSEATYFWMMIYTKATIILIFVALIARLDARSAADEETRG